MLINSQLVKDPFGQYYKIQTGRDKPAPEALNAEIFHNNIQATRFINNLTAPISFWSKIYNTEALISKPIQNNNQLISAVAELFSQGKVKAFKIEIPSYSEHAPEKRTVTDANRNQYTFTQASTLLISNPKEVKSFTNIAEAKKYLSEIAPDENKLKEISQELNVPSNINSQPFELMANSLASGEIVIMVDKYSAPPANKQSADDTVHGDKNAGSGPEAAAAAVSTTNANIEHLCKFNKMTLSCKHGRSATLDPSIPNNQKTGKAPTPFLAVTSVPQSSSQKDQELITAKIETDDKCDNHIKSPFTITSDTAKLVNNNFGDVIKFHSPGEELNLATEFYKYIWLPSIKPLSYKVIPPSFCDMTQFEGKEKNIRVDVYPDIKWDLGMDIGFGQIKVSDLSPTKSVVERKIEQEVFSITGHAKCTHGKGNTVEFVSKFSNKFDELKQEIDGQNALLSKVFGKFQEGNNHSVTLDLPKLSFSGNSSIAEKSGSHEVDTKWDYTIKAAPLIGINASVDVLPMLLKSSGWGTLFLPLLSELKEKYANPDGSVGVQLEASIILSIAGKVEFDLNFTDSTFVRDEKEQLRSLKFDVPFNCKGELKGKGHLLVFAAELGVLAQLDSGFAYEMFMGADASGIYRSSILHFHGLTFEIKAYIEGKREAPAKDKTGKADLFKNKTISIKRRKEYENKWTWIDKSSVEFDKEYIIESS